MNVTNTPVRSSNRVKHVDIAKGISIFLVALFHSDVMGLFPSLTEPLSMVRMPLFFFISGVFFSYRKDFNSFTKRKADSLLKPYLTVSFLVLGISILTSEQNIAISLFGVLYGTGNTIRITPLWFLTHLFALSIAAYILLKYLRFETFSIRVKLGFSLIFLALGIVVFESDATRNIHFDFYPEAIKGLPFSVDLLPASLAYFLLGHTLKHQVTSIQINTIIFSVAFASLLYIGIYTDAVIGFNERLYRNPFYATLGAAAGIYLTLSISRLIGCYKYISSIPLLMGRASLFILIFHTTIQNRSTLAIEKITPSISNEGNAVISFVMSVAIPILFYFIAKRYKVIGMLFIPSTKKINM